MSTTEHTPIPWHINGRYIQRGNRIVAELWAKKNPKQVDANGEFIVRACNNHGQLLEACQELLALLYQLHSSHERNKLPEEIRAEAALAAAEVKV